MRYVDGVVLEGQDLALDAVLVRLGVAHLQRVNGTVPATAIRLRDELAAFAARETAAVVVSASCETAKPAAMVIVAESLPAEMTVQAAAGLLGISPQAVRGLCRSGALLAVRGPGGWRIGADSAADLAAKRKGEARNG